jgi:hypothetical protein
VGHEAPQTGDAGEALVQYVFATKWRWAVSKPTKDSGWDLDVTLGTKGDRRPFRVQVRSSDKLPRQADGCPKRPGYPVKELQDARRASAFLIVLCDLTEQAGYWVWAEQVVDGLLESAAGQTTVTLSVPMNQTLDNGSKALIEGHVRQWYERQRYAPAGSPGLAVPPEAPPVVSALEDILGDGSRPREERAGLAADLGRSFGRGGGTHD